jgi:hypothetical protein
LKCAFCATSDAKDAHELNYSIICFIGSIATGDLNFTSTQPVPPPLVPHPPQRSELQPEPNPRSSISNQPPQVPLPSQISIGLGGVEGLEVDIGTHNLEDLDVTSGKERKQSQMAARLGDYLGFRKSQIQKAQEAIEEKKKREEDYSIEKCIDIVDATEGLFDEEKADANEVFENETHRKVFVGTKNPNVRLIWLKKKIARLSTPSSAASSEN